MLAVAMSTTPAKFYATAGSHPCAAVEAALKLKAIDYRRVELLALSQVIVGPLRYGGTTVPGMVIDGERLVGSRKIMRRLDALAPEPPLLPDPGEASYARVLEIERWGDEVFQSMPRRIIDVAFLRCPSAMTSYTQETGVPLPDALVRPALPLFARLMALKNGASEASARADIAALPGALEQIDGWIAEGLLGGELPERRRPAARQHDPPAAEHRRPSPADRRPTRTRGRRAHALLPADGRRGSAPACCRASGWARPSTRTDAQLTSRPDARRIRAALQSQCTGARLPGASRPGSRHGTISIRSP